MTLDARFLLAEHLEVLAESLAVVAAFVQDHPEGSSSSTLWRLSGLLGVLASASDHIEEGNPSAASALLGQIDRGAYTQPV
jgi:hypothetical protein